MKFEIFLCVLCAFVVLIFTTESQSSQIYFHLCALCAFAVIYLNWKRVAKFEIFLCVSLFSLWLKKYFT